MRPLRLLTLGAALVAACTVPRLGRRPGSDVANRPSRIAPSVTLGASRLCSGGAPAAGVSGATVGVGDEPSVRCAATADTTPDRTLDGRTPRPIP